MANKPFSFDFNSFAQDIRTAVRRVYVITSPEAYARQIPEADFNRHLSRSQQGNVHESARRQFVLRAEQWDLHPAVGRAWELARPVDHHQLVLEWPHRSESDPSRLAYTKDWRDWSADKQLITTVGKYLTRHFPSLADHQIRDIVALTTEAHEMGISYDTDEFVRIANEGPDSCMNWSGDSRDHWVHPYRAYDPAYGWGIAYRKSDGRIDGRCIVNDESKTFVRSFKRGPGYSYSDEVLEAWLVERGYCKADSWRGHYLAVVPDDYRRLEFVAPYLDGDVRSVRTSQHKGIDALLVDERGDMTFDNTDGTCDRTDRHECSECGDHVDEDDIFSTYHGESVCRWCIEDAYVEAICGGYRDFVRRDSAVYAECHDEWYHENCAGDYVVYSDHYGEYIDRDDAVHVAGDWYREDDDDIVYCDDGEYRLTDDCVECHDGEWRPAEDCVPVNNANTFETVWADKDDDTIVQLPSGDYYFLHDTVYDAENDVYLLPFTYNTDEYSPSASRSPLATSLLNA